MNLFQHQLTGAAYLVERTRGYLGDVPGLGKTRTLLEAYKRRFGSGTPALIVCPAIVRSFWKEEMQSMDLDPKCMVVCSYDQLVRMNFDGAHGMVRDLQPKVMILDELHYCKHPSAQRTRLVLGKGGLVGVIKTVWGASGTPVPRNPLEYWPVLSSLFPEIAVRHGLKNTKDFIDRFVVLRRFEMHGRWIEKPVGARNLPEFKQILHETMLRRELDDVGIDVPKLFWQAIPVDTDDTTLTSYDVDMALHMLIDGSLTPEQMLRDPEIARYRKNVGLAKVNAVVERLAFELDDSDEKVVVFAYHRDVLAKLRDGLKTFGVAYIDGDTIPKHREEAIERFQNQPSCQVFLGQNIACQTGITLHASHRVVLVEPEWSEDVNVQLGHRVARIGQTAERCIGQRICLAGTLDEWITRQNMRESELHTEMFTA